MGDDADPRDEPDPRAAWRTRLLRVGVDNAAREIEWLIDEVCGGRQVTAGFIPTPDQRETLEVLVARREAGEPLQYVLGHWPFRTVDLAVDARALIPRPETEQVAGVALWELGVLGVEAPVVVDLGTGGGAIALAVAVEHPSAWVLGVDASGDALELAMENRDRLGLGVRRVALARSSWFSRLPDDLRGVIDLIVTNPPYVAEGEEIDESVRRWEPAEALFAGEDGLEDLGHIIAEAPGWLAPDGVLVAEIGATQGAAVTEFARRAGFDSIEIRPDLAGHDRVLVARTR